MSPPALRARVRDAVLAHIDQDAWGRSIDQEQEEQDRLADRKDQIMAILNGG
jgi:hypothetical protein